MAVVQRDMSIGQLNMEVRELRESVEQLQRVARGLARCIKALWMVLAPVATGLIIRWITLSNLVK